MNLFSSPVHESPAGPWRPAVLAVAGDPYTLAKLARLCLPMEPYARWLAVAQSPEALERLTTTACDLLLVDAASLPPMPGAFLLAARGLRPGASCAVIGTPGHGPQWPPIDGVRLLGWDDLPGWLAQELARLRCRAQLAALDIATLGDTTLPSPLASCN